MTRSEGLAEPERVEPTLGKTRHGAHVAGRTRRLARARDWFKQYLYRAYERRLVRQIDSSALPRHIGIILDGNRRFGRRRRIQDLHQLYALGAGKLDDVLDWCVTLGIPALTLWVCSTKNLERPAESLS